MRKGASWAMGAFSLHKVPKWIIYAKGAFAKLRLSDFKELAHILMNVTPKTIEVPNFKGAI